ncbi:phage portal protein family protein [Thermosphaera sp.]
MPAIAPHLDVDRVARIFQMAEVGATEELFTLYRDMMLSDSHAQSEWSKRKLAVIGKPMSVIPADEQNADDVETAQAVREQIEGARNWLPALGHLLDSTLYPVALVEKVYEPVGNGYRLRELVPVPHRLLDFSSGSLRIRDVDARGRPSSVTHWPDPNRYIVHRGHLLGVPDHFGGPMRAIVFWWLLSVMDRSWWARFLDRFGAPFLIGKYDQADDVSRRILERAFDLATRLGGLVISRDTEVEIKHVMNSDEGTGFERFLTICQREKSKLIIGQTLSAEAQATGLGSGVAVAHEAVRDDIREFDAMMLSGTLRDQLFAQIVAINRLPGRPPTLVLGGESHTDIRTTAETLELLARSGHRVVDEDLTAISKRLGFRIERASTRTPTGIVPFASPGLSAPNADIDLDAVAAAVAADLTHAFRGDLAPVARIVRESRSADDCVAALRHFTATWRPGRAASLIAEALTAYAANAIKLARFP